VPTDNPGTDALQALFDEHPPHVEQFWAWDFQTELEDEEDEDDVDEQHEEVQ
jgi:hypothetical protein